jgi:hypothetical protein
MPPERIDSLNADSLNGLVLSLLAKIGELFKQNQEPSDQNKKLLAQISALLARIAELEAAEDILVILRPRSTTYTEELFAHHDRIAAWRRNDAAKRRFWLCVFSRPTL